MANPALSPDMPGERWETGVGAFSGFEGSRVVVLANSLRRTGRGDRSSQRRNRTALSPLFGLGRRH